MGEDKFDLLVYLKGRREYLKAIVWIWPPDSYKHKCAQARLFEVMEILALIEGTNA
jgi:hypothetical protein